MTNFENVLTDVQEYISSKFAIMSSENIKKNQEQLKAYIKHYLNDYKLKVDGYTTTELVEALYYEMAEYGFLTKYLLRNDIEEININSWDDVKITYSDGRLMPTKEKFNSPSHAVDIIRRLLHKSGMILDNSQPIVVGHLSSKIRITAMLSGVVDKEVGIAVSIRIVNPKKLKKEDFVKYGTAKDEMLDFLEYSHRYGESICLTGATSSGKTTLLSYLLSSIPNNKRLASLEDGTREFNLVKRDENGNVLNNVIHLVTRYSDDKKQNITMVKLLQTVLTINPDYICVAEMKSEEAFFAQEAARTGHAVTTTIHASSALATYYRMITLCKQKYDMNEKTLYNLVTEAFPIIVFCKKLEDNSRKIMEITECYIDDDGQRHIKSLYRYKVTRNDKKDDKAIIEGHFEKLNNISSYMQKRLLENGMPQKILERFVL